LARPSFVTQGLLLERRALIKPAVTKASSGGRPRGVAAPFFLGVHAQDAVAPAVGVFLETQLLARRAVYLDHFVDLRLHLRSTFSRRRGAPAKQSDAQYRKPSTHGHL